MKSIAILPAALALASCSFEIDDASIPAEADIQRVERKLADHPCVGDLGQWERNYRYSRKTGLFSDYSLNPDLDVIEFHLRRAGTIAIAPGRNVMRTDQTPDWPDTRTIRTIDGRYKIEGGLLDLARCEPLPPG